MDQLLPVELLANWSAAAAAYALLPTQDAAWTLASLFAFPGRAQVLAAGPASQPTAIAPLVQRGPLLELPGCGATGEPVDFFASSEDAMAELAASLARDGRPLLLETAAGRGLTLHIDAVGPDWASPSQEVGLRLNAVSPGKVGCTLPGRWARSAADAAALADSGLRIRVVKGEFENPAPNWIPATATWRSSPR